MLDGGLIRDLERVSAHQPWPLEVFTLEFQAVWDAPGTPRFDRAYGKGVTEEEARRSAIGEAIERHSGVYRGDEPMVEATLHELGEAALHPNACMGYSAQQYAERAALNAQAWGLPVKVPEPFDPDAVIPWTPLSSRTHDRIRYLPTAYCYYQYDGAGASFCAANSNGCAAGATLDEAVFRGLLELIERDAVALWWYNRIPRPQLDLDQLDDPVWRAFKAYFQNIDRDFWVVDVTSDLGVPVYVALSTGARYPQDALWVGSGAHLNPITALHSALLEVGQQLPFLHRNWYASRRDASQGPTALPAHLSFLRARHVNDPVPQISHEETDAKQALAPLLARCEQQGLEVLVLNQNRSDLEIPVARVVAPSLRHFWRRTGPGRLYDLPVAMGWLPSPRAEADLNPDTIHG